MAKISVKKYYFNGHMLRTAVTPDGYFFVFRDVLNCLDEPYTHVIDRIRNYPSIAWCPVLVDKDELAIAITRDDVIYYALMCQSSKAREFADWFSIHTLGMKPAGLAYMEESAE